MVRRPTARKKLRARNNVCANVFGFPVELSAPGQDEFARVSVLISRSVVVNQSVQQVSRHAVVTVLSSLLFLCRLPVGKLLPVAVVR